MWASIGATIWSFNSINKTASYLLVPYFDWISFATILTINIWQRHKDKKITKFKTENKTE